VDANGTREIEEAVQKALAKAGIDGTVQLSGRTLSLRAGGAPVEIDAMYLVEQWPLLPEDLRERKAVDVAARLADSHKAAKTGVIAPGAPTARYVPSVKPTGVAAKGPRKPVVIPVGTLLLMAAVVAVGAFWWKSRTPDGAAGAPTATAKPESEDERRARVCDVARNEVLRTGNLAQLDSNVWLAELWLATSKAGDDMTRTKAVQALVDQGKLTASADPDLAALREAQVEIVGDESALRAGSAWRGAHVRFRGGYVTAFFDKAGREKMNAVAGRLADAMGAELGAFYGRCAHLPYHDIGAWFRGTTPAQASAAMVYAMGFFSERRVTNRDPSAPTTVTDLAALTTALAKLNKSAFESAVSASGGTFAPGLKDAPTVITFPLFGPTLATRASGLIAESAGMGPNAPRPAASP